jgi:ELWxxDGT repeat protein
VGQNLFFLFSVVLNQPALWTSDGTPAGTVRLTTGAVRPAPYTEIAALGSTVFFDADDGVHGPALWKTDGTMAGTVPVDPVGWSGGGARKLTVFQGRLFYFLGNDPVHLWSTDGTPQGTVEVADLHGSFHDDNPPLLQEFRGRLYFFAREDRGSTFSVRLWSTDGTAAGTMRAASFGLQPADDFFPSSLAVAGDRLYISGAAATSGLWVSDGTEPGTRLIAPNVIIAKGSIYGAPDYVDYRGLLVFEGPGGDPGSGTALWTSDGTAAGTAPLLDANGQKIQGVQSLRVLADRVVFAAPAGGNATLWQSDLTPAGTTPILPLGPGAEGFGEELTIAGPRLYVRAYDPVVGDQLWALRPD